MPNIKEYTSSIDKLSPDDKGYQAHEMAGRRLGPLYSQMASENKEQSRIDAQSARENAKGNVALIDQLEKMNDEQLQALGEDTNIRKRAAAGGGGSSGGGGSGGGLIGGGGRGGGRGGGGTPSDFAQLAADLTGTAMSLSERAKATAEFNASRAAFGVGHQEGRGLYEPGEDKATKHLFSADNPDRIAGGYDPVTGETNRQTTHIDPNTGDWDWSSSTTADQNPTFHQQWKDAGTTDEDFSQGGPQGDTYPGQFQGRPYAFGSSVQGPPGPPRDTRYLPGVQDWISNAASAVVNFGASDWTPPSDGM